MTNNEVLQLYGDMHLHPVPDEGMLGPLLRDLMSEFHEAPEEEAWVCCWNWSVELTATVRLCIYPDIRATVQAELRDDRNINDKQEWREVIEFISKDVTNPWKTSAQLSFRGHGARLCASLAEDGRWHITEAEDLNYLSAQKLMSVVENVGILGLEYDPIICDY